MNTAKKSALIALSYAVAIAAGFAAVTVNETAIPASTAQGSPGMVAFGDMVLFILVTGFFALVPTSFLLWRAMQKWPRALLSALLLLAVLGPLSWLTMVAMGREALARPSAAGHDPGWIGLWIAFVAIPRIVVGPVLVLGEGAALLLSRNRSTRLFLALAMAMDLIPLGIFAQHMVSALA
jgi:hypothetical protein